MLDPSLVYRKKFLANQLSYRTKYKSLFDKVAKDISVLASDPTAKFTKDFNFSKSIDQKIAVIMTDFHDKAQALTEDEIRASWAISNEKNDTIVGDYLKGITEAKGVQKAAYFLSNIPALEAFISRDHGTGTLSDAVWRVTDQLRGEMEIHLGMGIANGDSAQVISRRIRQYLENPEALFRRVRNADGKLVASQAMLANAPGKGVYNSAFKNAMRVSRTETNMAYLLADHIRWMQLDMVIGVKISLSAQHPDYKFVEICEACEGTYPKEFIWIGWHPQCLCHATPVMMPQNDFKAYLRGEKPLKAKQIAEYPIGFQDYMKNNLERYSGYKSVPYFMQDNPKVIENIMKGKLSVASVSPISTITENVVAKTEASTLAKALEAKEGQIRLNKSFETAVAFNKEGSIIFEKKGGSTSVAFSDAEVKLFKNTIFTHNHPRGWSAAEGTMGRIGNSFSPADVLLALRNDVQELRAVTPNFTFVMERPIKGWIGENAAIKAINRINIEVQTEFSNRLYDKLTTIKKAETVHWHEVWKRFSKEFGVKYYKFKAI